MMIEVNESTPHNMVSIIFTGATYAYKDCLKEHGVAGGRLFQKYVQNGTYYHLMKNLDVGLDENRKKVIHVIERVFDSLVMRAKTSGKAAPQGSDTEAFIAELEVACPNLFFDKANNSLGRRSDINAKRYVTLNNAVKAIWRDVHKRVTTRPTTASCYSAPSSITAASTGE